MVHYLTIIHIHTFIYNIKKYRTYIKYIIYMHLYTYVYENTMPSCTMKADNEAIDVCCLF